jgi:hypothetical protein
LFENWHDDFMFRRVELLAGQAPFVDEFDASLNPRWDWVDLLGDCAYSLTEKPGYLTVHAPSLGTSWWGQGHDLFWLSNFDAPRLLQPIQGDFVLETRLSAASHPQANYQAAGLLAWQDTWHYVRLERNAWWGGSVYGGLHSAEGTPWTFRPVPVSDLDLRLSRVGDTFAAWYRQAGAPAWSELGQATAAFSETLLVGLAAYNQGNWQPVAAEFDYFHVSQLAPPLFSTPCGVTNQAQPVIRGLATAGAQVRLYADGSLAATTTASFQGTSAVSPTLALGPGSHTLTATVTSGSQESPPSSDLNLTVEPGASVDFIGVTITHWPLFGGGPPVTDFLRNGDGCAACDGSGFNVWIPGRKPITVSLPISATGVVSAQVLIGGIGYALDDPDGDSVYQGTFTPPEVRGVASLGFVVYRAGGLIIDYACGEIIIDPYGVVYDAAIGPSAPISGAVVTLYEQDPATWTWNVWSPTDGQENPQTTGSDGRYAFNVLQGTYYVTVEAAGFMSFASQPIQVSVETGPVELLVPLNRDRIMVEVYLPFIAR